MTTFTFTHSWPIFNLICVLIQELTSTLITNSLLSTLLQSWPMIYPRYALSKILPFYFIFSEYNVKLRHKIMWSTSMQAFATIMWQLGGSRLITTSTCRKKIKQNVKDKAAKAIKAIRTQHRSHWMMFKVENSKF